MTDDFNKTVIIPTNAGDGRYYYTDVFNYDCQFGYKKSEVSNITCLANKTWTTTPNCTKTGKGLCYTDSIFSSLSSIQSFYLFSCFNMAVFLWSARVKIL